MKRICKDCELKFTWIIFVILHSYQVKCSPPVIIEHPEDIIVAKNEPVTLRCEAEGEPQPEISWWKDGKPVSTAINGHNTHRLLLPSGSLFFLKAVYSRKEDDGGTYFCQAENSDGFVRSRNATLTIAVLRDKFRVEPEDQGVERGQTVRLQCAPPKGMPPPTVFWKRNGKFIDLEQEERLHLEGEGDLVIEGVTEEDEGKYQCLAKNVVGTRSTDKVEVAIQVKPFIIKHPENISVVAGEEIRLGCVVGGRPPPEVRWGRQNGQLPANRIVVTDNSVLTIRNVIPDDEDLYVCNAENPVGSVQASATVQIHSPPIFLVEPTDQKVAEGAPAVLDCIAAGNPTPTLFWMKEADSSILLPGSSTNQLTVTPEGTLRITSVSADDDSGWYSCAAVSESGSCLARAEVAVAKDTDRPPPILQLGPVNQTLPLGSTGSLPCQATSQETLITWLKDGVPIDHADERIHLDEENTLTIKELLYSDSGLYSCQARSSGGQAVWSASLTVADQSNPEIQFKSMPYFSQFPASPSMPIFVNATSTSITVAWDKPHRIGGSPLKGYQLDYYTLATPSHWLTVQDVRQEVFTLSKLPPLTTIVVLVRALNQHGLSPPSPLSKPMRTQTKGNLDGGKDELGNNKDKNPALIRLRLSQRVLELQEAVSVTSKKVKVQWELLSAKQYVEGYHIHVRDLSSHEMLYDVVTIAGGPTRSHTLSDLRPHTKYSIFIVPFYLKIKGRPSNMKTVQTKEDVPTSPPESLEVQQVNSSTGLLQWSPPPARELHGDLKGYKISIEIEHVGNDTGAVEFSNYTLEPEVTSLILHNMSNSAKYTMRVAAYTRQGIGPMSNPVILRLDANPTDKSFESPPYADQAIPAHDVVAAGGGTEVGGLDLIIQEVWFVSVMGLLVLVILLAFVATVWVRRQRSNMKNIGHYNVPVHKVDDITHVNFTDRDHLWFDPNWTKSNGLDGTPPKKSANEDPMAAMLENNCKNRNATNIFINKLAQLNSGAPEYAEVDGIKGLPNSLASNGSKRPFQSHPQGPYATTTLIEPTSNPSSAHHSNTSTGTSLANGSALTSTPLRSNSTGRPSVKTNTVSSNSGTQNHNSNSQQKLAMKEENEASTRLMEKGEASMTSSSSGSTGSKRLREPSQPPPPLPPPPADSLMLNYFSSPQALPRNTRHTSVTDARLYNRSLMGTLGQDPGNGLPPPVPPARGPSSYNGVRTGSFASFGHVYPNDPRLFGPHLHQSNGLSHSHYSVPGIFYSPHHQIQNSGCCPNGFIPAQSPSMQKGPVEDQYESASVCSYGPLWLGHSSIITNGYENHEMGTECCDDQGWEWESNLSGDEECAPGCDEEESFYAGYDTFDAASGNKNQSDKRSNQLNQDETNRPTQNGGMAKKFIHQKSEGREDKAQKVSVSAQPTPVNGRRKRSVPRPSSVCSTDSNFSSVSSQLPAGYGPIAHHGYGHRRPPNRLHPKRANPVMPQKGHTVSSSGEIYSTFKPPVSTTPQPQINSTSSDKQHTEPNSSQRNTPEKTSQAKEGSSTIISEPEEDETRLFAQVSQDMTEMVQHLNTIQHDISELAGRPISLYDNT